MAKGMHSPSERRLWELIEQRSEPGADREAIDARIWETFGEPMAVVFTDLAGFSRTAREFGILHFLQIIHEKKKLLEPVVAEHNGLILKQEADSFLMTFRKPESALRCAVEMQRVCQRASADRPPEEKILLCVGVGYGEVLRVGDHDVWGAEVNAASKLGEDTAESHQILATEGVRNAIGEMEGLTFGELAVDVPGTARAFVVGYERGDASESG